MSVGIECHALPFAVRYDALDKPKRYLKIVAPVAASVTSLVLPRRNLGGTQVLPGFFLFGGRLVDEKRSQTAATDVAPRE